MQQRPQRLMEQFSRHGHDVLYMNLHNTFEPSYYAEENLLVIRNHNEVFAEVDKRRLTSKIVLFSMWTENWYWHDHLKPDFTIYDYIDDFKVWEQNMPAMVQRSNLITCTADKLLENIRQWYPNHPSLLVENACEFEHFTKVNADKLPIPEEMPKKKPIIGYVGALAHWMDWELLRKISDKYTLVLIGGEFGGEWIHSPNVYRLGERHYKTLPNYMQQMDVLIIPFLLNDITKATNPIKMWEYLATGKPIVTTNIPETIKAQGNIHVADTHEQFMYYLELAIHQDTEENKKARMELAKINSWEARYKMIYSEILKTK